MKKNNLLGLLLVLTLFVVGCGTTKEKTVEDLLDDYIESYLKADPDMVKKVFPPFYMEYAKEYMTKEYLEQALLDDKESLGDDFTITYDIKNKEKINDEDLETVNSKMESQYNAEEKASECYKLEGTMTFKGSKDELVEELSSIHYCKYSDTWYLIRVY